jgi:hypothetical protein
VRFPHPQSHGTKLETRGRISHSLSQYGIPLAILDDPPVRPACHVFAGSKAQWFEITDELPQYAEYAPTT